ncbi:MAG TPA: DUF4238 domain-containing protein [Solirubrobacterales bacterium]
MEYTEVKNAHIVPRSYLKNFAVEEKIMLIADGKALGGPISIDNAAIRKRFYRRFRPNGEPIYDIEWSLSQLENVVAPMLGTVATNWPLPSEEKHALAEYFAYQFVRGPRWKAWREEMAREEIAKHRRNPEPVLHKGIWIAQTQKQINQEEDRLLSESEWLTRMMVIANRLITAFGSMRWHLIEFDEPLLAISDHPVVAWPLAADYRRPEPTPAGLGVLNFLEVRAPISSSLLLLMLWQDLPDASEILAGSEDIAANANAFTIANAERQWMHLPGGKVPIAEGYLDPISVGLVPSFGRPEVEASRIRHTAGHLLEQKIGQDIHDAVDENGRMQAQIVPPPEPA